MASIRRDIQMLSDDRNYPNAVWGQIVLRPETVNYLTRLRGV